MTLRFIACLHLFLAYLPAQSQLQSSDSSQMASNSRAMAHFFETIRAQKEIYDGPEHVPFPPQVEGTAYLTSKEWQQGTIQFDAVAYPNESLLYDVYKDQLVVQRTGGFAVELRRDKIDWFSLPGHLFVNIRNNKNLKSGFYDQLASGRMTVLARHEKKLEEKVQEGGVRQWFDGHVTYYAIYNNDVHTIRNLKSLLSLMGTRSNAVQQQLRKAGIRYKKNAAVALATAATVFNQTQP